MSEILKSPSRNQNQLSAFLPMFSDVSFILNCFNKHDISDLIYLIIHMENTFKAMHCHMYRKCSKEKEESQSASKKST